MLARPRLAIFLSLLLTAVMAAGLVRLDFSHDYRVFFDPSGEERQALERLERRFGLGESVVMVLRPTDSDVFTPAFLAALEKLRDRFRADPAVRRAHTILDLPVKRIREGFPEVEPVVPSKRKIDSVAVAEVRRRALGDKTVVARLVRRDGRAAAVVMDVSRTADLRRAAARLRAIERDFRKLHPTVQTGLTGIAPLNDGFIESTVRDLQLFLPLTLLALIVTMLLLLRRLLGVVASLSVVSLAAAAAMGMAGWLDMPLTPAGAGAPIVIMTIAIASSIHVLITFRRRFDGDTPKLTAIRKSYRVNLLPIFLTSLTTLFGLLALNFSDAPPFRDLGNIAAIGIALAFVHSVVFLPALIAIWPAKPGAPVVARSSRGLGWIGANAGRRPWLVLLVFAVVGGGLGAMIPRLAINDVYFEYLDKSLPVRQGTDFSLTELPSVCTLHWRLDANQVLAPAFLRRVDGFAGWLRDRPNVRYVLNPVDFVRREAGGRLPRDAGKALTNLRGARAEMKDPALIDRVITQDGRSLHVMVSLGRSSSADVQAIAAAALAYLNRHMPAVADKAATGPCLMFATIAETNIRSMLWGTLVAFVLVALTLVLALGKLWLGLLSLVPNLLPPLIAFGLWSLLVGEVGLAASITAATALGIIVDATIHLSTRYRRAREAGADVDDAIQAMLAGVGVAVWVAAAIVIGGFAVLALSTFQVNRDVGLLTVLTLAAALVIDLVLLPALLKLCDRQRGNASGAGAPSG